MLTLADVAEPGSLVLPRVFLSYSRGDDEPFVKRLHADLTARGFTVWFDRESLMSRGATFHQEIKDAILKEVDRLVYVGGPKAKDSKNVKEEWHLALECDKIVVPILRVGDGVRASMPSELGMLHCEDFRKDADYPAHLEKFIGHLTAPAKPLGALFAVPGLPPNFLARPELMNRVRDALLVDLQTAKVITSADSRVGMQGMGGIGKSVLAAALARNRQVRQAYPDGIIWVSCGEKVDDNQLISMLRDVGRHLGNDEPFDSVPQGQGILRKLLIDKAALIILDDVWKASVAQAFDVLGPRSRLLVTTRDAGILHALNGELVPVSLFSEEEALQLLADSVGTEPSALSREAREVIHECGLLPLALALCGGMAKKRGGNFRSVLERLRRADLDKIADRESINEQHNSIWRAMQASVNVLTEDDQRRFAELAVFDSDATVPEAAVATLWAHTGNLDDLDTEDLLINFAERSLIILDKKSDDTGNVVRRVSLHDLLYDYATRMTADATELHRKLLDAYKARCPNDWPSGPDDGYFLQKLRDHLLAADRGDDLAGLLLELRWLERKNEAGLVFDLPSDYMVARSHLPGSHRSHRILSLLEEALRRNINFVHHHRHDYPQALFQSLWNAGWWYDNPELKNYYEDPKGDLNRRMAQGTPRLWEIVEKWRVEKEAREGPFPWLRLRRPAEEQLGGALRFIFHVDGVDRIVVAPTGTRFAMKCNGSIGVWEAASGIFLGRLQGPTSSALGFVFSPEGDLLAALCNDQTLKIWNTATGSLLQSVPVSHYSRGGLAWTNANEIVFLSEKRGIQEFHPATGSLTVKEGCGPVSLDAWIEYSEDFTLFERQEGYVTVRNRFTGNIAKRFKLAEGTESIRIFNRGRTLAFISETSSNTYVLTFIDLAEEGGSGTLAVDQCRDYYSEDMQMRAYVQEPIISFVPPEYGGQMCAFPGGGIVVLPQGLHLEGNPGVYDLAFLPGNEYLVSAGTDNGIRVWRITPGVQQELPLKMCNQQMPTGTHEKVAISPDGRSVQVTEQATIRGFDESSKYTAETYERYWNVSQEMTAEEHKSNMAALPGRPVHPYVAESTKTETLIRHAETGRILAYYDRPFVASAMCPSRPILAGISNRHVYVLELSGVGR